MQNSFRHTKMRVGITTTTKSKYSSLYIGIGRLITSEFCPIDGLRILKCVLSINSKRLINCKTVVLHISTVLVVTKRHHQHVYINL